MISLWNTFNHTFSVFNITDLSDWREQAYLIQTSSVPSLCECIRIYKNLTTHIIILINLSICKLQPIFCLSHQQFGGYIYNVTGQANIMLSCTSVSLIWWIWIHFIVHLEIFWMNITGCSIVGCQPPLLLGNLDVGVD